MQRTCYLYSFHPRTNVIFVAFQETGRGQRTTFHAPAAGYTVHGSGHCNGDGDEPAVLGVGLAIEESIVSTPGPKGVVHENVSARILDVRVAFSHGVAIVSWVMLVLRQHKVLKDKFSTTLSRSIAEVPTNEHRLRTMDADARTGKREGRGLGEFEILGKYGRGNNNVGRLLKCAADREMAIMNTFFRWPTGEERGPCK